MPTRWRCPPENSCGKRFVCSGASPTVRSRSRTRASISASFSPKCTLSGSPRMAPTVMRGLSEAYGSWNTIWNRRRIAASCLPRMRLMGRPSNSTVPAVGVIG